MKKFAWKAPAVYVGIGAILGSTLMAAPAAMADSSFKSYWAKFSQNGQSTGSAQAIMYGGTNYFGIYYLQQLLKKDGIDATWNGSELSLNGVPVQQATTLSVATNSATSGSTSGSPLFTNSITVNGVTYVPLSTVQAMLAQAGVRLNEGDQGSSGSNNVGISAGNVQKVVSHLKDAENSLASYVKAEAKLQSKIAQGKKVDPGDAMDTMRHLTDGMARLQAAYNTLSTLQSMLATSSATTTTSGGTTVTSSVYGGSGSGSTAGAGVATQLGTIAAALKQDLSTLNAFALSSMGGGLSSANGGTGTTTGTSTSTSASSGTSSDLSSVMSDIANQIGALMGIENQLRANGGSDN